jgi:hypothetical protein
MNTEFQTYGVILTERGAPNVGSITIALLTKTHEHLLVKLDNRSSFVSQMLKALNTLDQTTKDRSAGTGAIFPVSRQPETRVFGHRHC